MSDQQYSSENGDSNSSHVSSGVESSNDGSNHPQELDGSSTLGAAVFNFTNSIVGAGCIGLGGAIAISGGLVSVACIIFFGLLTKLSLDMLISLTAVTDGAKNSFEELGRVAYGTLGRVAVLVSKTMYSFGCLVAYIIVVKDNFGSGLRHLIYSGASTGEIFASLEGSGSNGRGAWFEALLEREDLLTFLLSVVIVLPLCLLRDITPLAKFSAVSVFAMVAIVVIVVTIFAVNPGGGVRLNGGSTYENWFEIRPGILESLGTFVFTFVSQHTAHLAYESLAPDIRTVDTWRKVSSFSILIAAMVSLSIGVFVYMTFWEKTESDVFEIYPDDIYSIDVAKLLLCVTMLLTFPLPFFTCREMMVLMVTGSRRDEEREEDSIDGVAMRTSLLSEEFGTDLEDALFVEVTVGQGREQREAHKVPWTIPGNERQLILPYHIGVTIFLWLIVTVLAITAPSLGDVLDLVGCATGTVIAFILPALFSFKLVGYTHTAAVILIVGGSVGFVGTYFSSAKLLSDES